MGKGSLRRPTEVNDEVLEKRWERIFGPEPWKQQEEDEEHDQLPKQQRRAGQQRVQRDAER